jgi:small GTP-binding protein
MVEKRPLWMASTVELLKKVCLVGDSGVGKTSLIRRFVLDIFDDKWITTIGAKVTKKQLALDIPGRDLHVNLGLMIWDVSGQKEYRLFHEMYLKGMEGAIIVADLTRQNTFFSFKDAVSMIERNATNIPMIFLLNKCDLAEPSTVDLKDIRKLAGQSNIPVLATSAKTGMNVQLAFEQLGRKIVDAWMEKRGEQE